MVMSVAVDATFPLIQQIEHEGMLLQVYRVDKDTVHVDVRILGKSILNARFVRPHNSYKNYIQQAYDHVFYWHNSIVFQSPDERSSMLKELRGYWSKISDRELNPSPKMVTEFTVGEHSVKLTRFWHPSRLTVRIYCSLVVAGMPATVYPDFVMEAERKYSVSCDLPPNQKPPTEQDVVAALLAQLQ